MLRITLPFVLFAASLSACSTEDAGVSGSALAAEQSQSLVSRLDPTAFADRFYPNGHIDGGSVGACHKFARHWVRYNGIELEFGSAGPAGDTITYWQEEARRSGYLHRSLNDIEVGDLVLTDTNKNDLVEVHVAVVAEVLGGGRFRMSEASMMVDLDTVSTYRVARIDAKCVQGSRYCGVISLDKLRAGGGIE